jgi:hypothetical protein
MCWYKSKLLITAGLGFSLISGLQACKPDIKESRASMKYFDLQGFFRADSARLARLNPLILKTVKHNGVSESRKLHIVNWGTELSLFSQSDINKPAWKDSYSITADSNIIIYRALDSTLKTREILIKKSNGKVKYIMIENAVEKDLYKKKILLYKTLEKLSYFPDSLYLIQKSQTVRILGKNNYDIAGYFNQR